jgi:chemotaxis protein CheC
MNAEFLDSDQKDALQEISNIAMGSAASGLATVLESFVSLSIPRISIIETSRLTARLSETFPGLPQVSAVRQAFYGHMEGEVIVIFGEEGCNELADLLGHSREITESVKEELLLDVTNILIGACMNGMAHQLGYTLNFSAPAILCRGVAVDRVFAGHAPVCAQALLIQIDFALEARSFVCHLLTFLTPESFEPLRMSIARFLASL